MNEEEAEAGPSSGSGRGRVAYLGPEGTYGQQATRAFVRYLNEELDSVSCPTISDAYEEEAEYTVLPLENTIYGPVTETLDCFFARFDSSVSSSDGQREGAGRSGLIDKGKGKGKGKEKEIVATLDLPIRHCLVVKKGTKMEDIKVVSSHEQALGQSSMFLKKNLPHAKRIPVASTALAAESLLCTDKDDDDSEGRDCRAAICSGSVIGIYPELEVLVEGTQDRSDNFTRFLLLHSSTISSPIQNTNSGSTFYLLDNPNRIPQLLAAIKSNSIGSLHSRPIRSEDGRIYPHGIFIELKIEGDLSMKDVGVEGVLLLGSGPVVKLDSA